MPSLCLGLILGDQGRLCELFSVGRVKGLGDGDVSDPKEEIIDQGAATCVVPRPKVETVWPSQYRVILHNDDYTPMDFVVELLQAIFRKDHAVAQQIMLDVHHRGQGICGVYPFEIAETKVALTLDQARRNQYPLKCTMEEV